MVKLIRIAAICLFTALLGIGVAAPASADVSIRDAKASDLYVRSAKPSAQEMEKQFAALWNPNIPLSSKLAVSYKGDTAKVRKQVGGVMAMSRTMDFFSLKGRAIGSPAISGNRMTMSGSAVMAGMPANTTRYHYIRDGGLWKLDWKATCVEVKCNGNPDFGY